MWAYPLLSSCRWGLFGYALALGTQACQIGRYGRNRLCHAQPSSVYIFALFFDLLILFVVLCLCLKHVFGRLRLVLLLHHGRLDDGLFEFFAMGVEDQSGLTRFQVDFHRKIDVFSLALKKNCESSKATIDH